MFSRTHLIKISRQWKEQLKNMVMKTEEAKEAWIEESQKVIGLSGTYLRGISDFQTALIEALEEDKKKYIHVRDGWKEHSKDWEVYDLAVRICDQHISLIKSVTPKKK
jgi:hypothetical protein